uniref:Tumor protein D52 n=1 Tax=Caenorhabditis japonica TaxID=281687 RepID=A0A8R1DUJ3_CAEJA
MADTYQPQPGKMPKGNKKSNEKKEDIEKFAKELQGSDSDEDAVVIEQPTVEPPTPTQNVSSDNKKAELSAAEKDQLRIELDKTEEEISTLKQVLLARQKHSAELKRKLGLTPFSELSQDINRSLKTVTDTEAFQKTAEVAAATSDTVKEKWHDMRNSSLFKSFESKLGTAYNQVPFLMFKRVSKFPALQAKMAASTSIDHLAGSARGPSSQTGTPIAEEAKPIS